MRKRRKRRKRKRRREDCRRGRLDAGNDLFVRPSPLFRERNKKTRIGRKEKEEEEEEEEEE